MAASCTAGEPSILPFPEVGEAFAPDTQPGPFSPPLYSPIIEKAEEPGDSTAPDAEAQGLLYYKKWWYLREVDLSVRGELLTGIPIYFQQDTLRVVNDAFSYFIPMAHVDYIRTPDGLCAARTEFDGRSY